MKITNLRAERARRDDPQVISVAAPYVWSGSRPCSAEYYTHFNCTFPAFPCPLARATPACHPSCHLSTATATRYPPSAIRHPLSDVQSQALVSTVLL